MITAVPLVITRNLLVSPINQRSLSCLREPRYRQLSGVERAAAAALGYSERTWGSLTCRLVDQAGLDEGLWSLCLPIRLLHVESL